MAKIGLRYPVFAPIENENDGGLPTYGTGLVVGRAISADVSWSRSDTKLYADDTVAEVDNSVTGGSLTFGTDDLSDEAQIAMLNARAGEDGEVIEGGDSGTPGGFGYIRVQELRGVVKFIAYWIYKITFSPSDESAATKGENTDWQTPSITGEMAGVYQNGNTADFRAHKSFDNYEAAKAWLNAKAKIGA